MNDDKTTPRPWRVGPYPGHVEGNNRLVAGCNGHQNNVYPTHEENHANAELIVAAVNTYDAHQALVEAARNALRAFEQHLDEAALAAKLKSRDDLCPCNQNEVKALREALAAVEQAGKASS